MFQTEKCSSSLIVLQPYTFTFNFNFSQIYRVISKIRGTFIVCLLCKQLLYPYTWLDLKSAVRHHFPDLQAAIFTCATICHDPQSQGSFGNAWGVDKEGTRAAATDGTVPWWLQLCMKVTLPGYSQAEPITCIEQHLPQHCFAPKFMRTPVLEEHLNCSQISLNSDHCNIFHFL